MKREDLEKIYEGIRSSFNEVRTAMQHMELAIKQLRQDARLTPPDEVLVRATERLLCEEYCALGYKAEAFRKHLLELPGYLYLKKRNILRAKIIRERKILKAKTNEHLTLVKKEKEE